MTLALVFPGQGSQQVGMGHELAEAFPAAREVFEEVDDALGQHLSRIMFEGPEDTLTLTENAQPAIMAASLAVVRTLAAEGGFGVGAKAAFVAGHSLGEYSALAAAGAFSLADTARLLRIRGRAMQQAVPVGEGAMAALIGLDLAAAEEVAAEAAEGDEVCTCANDNAPGQVVVSGSRAAVERAAVIGREKGAKLAKLLPVSAPFHCPLMQPAADAMAEALDATRPVAPVVPVIANVTAAPVEDPDEIRRLLVEQVTGMVRWRESVETMKTKGVERIAELGWGKVLTGLVKRIDRDISAVNVGTSAEVEAFLKEV